MALSSQANERQAPGLKSPGPRRLLGGEGHWGIMLLCMKLRIAVRRLPVVFWSSIYVDPTNHGLRQSIPSNPVDPIQPQNRFSKNSSHYNTVYIKFPCPAYSLILYKTRAFMSHDAQKTFQPANEAYFRSLIEDAPDIITVTDRMGIIQYASPANRKVLGYEPEELLGKNAFFLVHPLDQFQALKIWGAGLLKPNDPHMVQFRYRHKDGSWRLFESIGKYVNDGSGPPRVILNSRDITERNETRRKLREMQEMYFQILDAIADMVLVKGPKSQIIWANKAFRDYYGMSNQGLEGLIDAPFNEPDFTQQYIKDDAQVFESGKTLEVLSEPVTRHDGEVRFFHTVKSAILNPDGQVTMTVGVCRDITERAKLEGIVRQSEKMSAVGLLAAGVAHEINNPLTVVLGFAQAILARLGEADPLFIAVKSIERETLRCRDLVQNLLTFSRKRKSGAAQEPILPLVEGVLSLVESQARLRKITVLRDFDKNAPPLLMDRALIQQVLINLCTNAMDAMPDGGTLTIRFRHQKRHVEIDVCDTGMGIPKATQSKIFEPFFTTKDVGKGTGLGLSLAYEIVKNHDGLIHFESREGKGTTFTIRLPITDAQTSAPPHSQAA